MTLVQTLHSTAPVPINLVSQIGEAYIALGVQESDFEKSRLIRLNPFFPVRKSFAPYREKPDIDGRPRMM
jgi:hypothetical protein